MVRNGEKIRRTENNSKQNWPIHSRVQTAKDNPLPRTHLVVCAREYYAATESVVCVTDRLMLARCRTIGGALGLGWYGASVVGFTDFLVLLANFGASTKNGTADGDIDENGVVDFTDFLLMSENFGHSKPM